MIGQQEPPACITLSRLGRSDSKGWMIGQQEPHSEHSGIEHGNQSWKGYQQDTAGREPVGFIEEKNTLQRVRRVDALPEMQEETEAASAGHGHDQHRGRFSLSGSVRRRATRNLESVAQT